MPYFTHKIRFLFFMAFLWGTCSNAYAQRDPVINEFVFNHIGIDDLEYFEIYGDPSTDYSNFTILVIEGDGIGAGRIDFLINVGTTNADSLWISPFFFNDLENGSQTLYLVENFTGNLNDDIDTGNDGIVDFAPWTRVVDAVAVSNGNAGNIFYTDVLLTPGLDGDNFIYGGASRIPNGTDTDNVSDWVRNDFDLAGITGASNPSPEDGEALNTPNRDNVLAVQTNPEPGIDPVINEFVFSHINTDNFEYLEIFGVGDADYSAYSILVIDGDAGETGVINNVFSIGITNVDGLWSTSFLTNAFDEGSATILIVKNFTGQQDDDLDTNDDGTLDITPWERIADEIGIGSNENGALNYTNIILTPGSDGNNNIFGGASRIPNGTDTDSPNDWVRNDFDLAGIPGQVGTPAINEALNTPGLINGLGQTPTPNIDPIINEFVANHAGTDTNEFIEVFGEVSANYSGFTILEIDGDGNAAGVIDEIIRIGSTNSAGIWLSPFQNSVFENGALTFLIVQDFTGILGQDLDANNDGVFDQTPWSRIVDDVSVSQNQTNDIFYSNTVLLPNVDGRNTTFGGASRIPNGFDSDNASDWLRNDFDLAGIPGFTGTPESGEAFNTPGEINEGVTTIPPPPSNDITKIHTIQGNGLQSNLNGQMVTIQGIVVGDFEGAARLNGFFVQEEDIDQDQDISTSEGIFIFNNGLNEVNEGDRVTVVGQVQEFDEDGNENGFQPITRLINTSVTVESSGNTLPFQTIIILPFSNVNAPEQYEGMRVRFSQQLHATDLFNFGRFGQILLSSQGPLIAPTNIVNPGSAANGQEGINGRDQITLDDDNDLTNLTNLPYLINGINPLRRGDFITSLSGIMSQKFNQYLIRPQNTNTVQFQTNSTRPNTPPSVGGRLEVVSFNLGNLFLTLDNGQDICGPNGERCRGADTPQELDRQFAKLIPALLSLDADIIGVQEIENNPNGELVLQELINRLNTATAPNTYAFINTGVVGSQVTKVGIIYKPNEVTPVGNFAVLDNNVDPRFNTNLNRASLAQTFEENSTSAQFTVVVNHFKSKDTPLPGEVTNNQDNDQNDGQGTFNFTRTQAALALVDWLASNPTNTTDTDFLIIGDLNAYLNEDPITTIKNGSYQNLVDNFANTNPYSSVVEGQQGLSDYAFANTDLNDQITGAAIWHINADEARALDFNSFNPIALFNADPFRSAEHDPVIIGLDLSTGDEPVAGVIESFTLINATTNQPILINGSPIIPEGTTINLDQLPTTQINIRANANPAIVGSVVFVLSGGTNLTRTDNFEPYALFGDADGNFNAWDPAPQDGQSFTLTATPFSDANGQGQNGQALTISFSFEDTNQPPTNLVVQSFTLIDAENNEPIEGFDPIPIDAQIDINTLPTDQLNIRANTDPNVVGSVVFELSGSQTVNRTDNQEPYAVFGDSNGDFNTWTPIPQPGQGFVLKATPFSAAAGQGQAGEALTLSFAFVDNQPQDFLVESFSLVNAETNQPIPGFDPIQDGVVIDFNALPTNQITIVANTDPTIVGSVVFNVNGSQVFTQVESGAPYSLFGDNNGDFIPWTPIPQNGQNYTISATPFNENGGNGQAGRALTINFSFANSLPPALAGVVQNFTLINTASNQPIPGFDPIQNGAIIDLDALPTSQLSIRANTNPSTVGSVIFDLSGAQSRTEIDNNSPYALFGDNNGNFEAWIPTPQKGQNYTLTATPFSEANGSGQAGEDLTISFSFAPEPAPTGTLEGFTLINAETNQPIAGFNPIPNGAVIDLQSLPTDQLNIRANTNPSIVGSVIFEISGTQSFVQSESSPPYSLFGDDNGDYASWSPTPQGGESYTLTGTPFSEAGGQGQAGQALTINFSFVGVPPPVIAGTVESFTLINAETNQAIAGFEQIPNGAAINLSDLPTAQLNIRANTNPNRVGSVLFNLRGGQNLNRTDNLDPYSLFGDNNGNFNIWTPDPQAGEVYTLTATPYSEANRQGDAGQAFTITFSFTDTPPPPPVAGVIESFTLINALTDQPVPGFDPIPNGTVIDLVAIGTNELNVRANVNPGTVGSVLFELNGIDFRTDNFSPYGLFSENNGNYNSWAPAPEPGDVFTVTATPFSGSAGTGQTGQSLTINFSFASGVPVSGVVQSFTLMNANTNQPIPGFNPIPDGAQIDLRTLPTDQLNIRANTNPNTVGSVVFNLNGAQSLQETQSRPPYALFGDNNGDYKSWIPGPSEGDNFTLTATPYDRSAGRGNPGQSRTINFSFTRDNTPPPPNNLLVRDFTLINALTDLPIAGFDPIPNGAVIDINELPTNQINIRANVNTNTVGSVAFNLNGAQNLSTIENAPPYALFGNAGNDFRPWIPIPQNGQNYVLSATAFKESNARGESGATNTISFSFADKQVPNPGSGDLAVQSFSLINAQTNQPIPGFNPIPDGAVINLAELPTRDLNVLANVNAGSVPGPDPNPTPNPSRNEIWLEAECATFLGSAWEIVNEPTASGGKAIRVPDNSIGGQFLRNPPVNPIYHVIFDVDIPEDGNYHVYMRERAAIRGGDASNSIYRDFNEPNPATWQSQTDLTKSDEFRWIELKQNKSFFLRKGINKLYFGVREDGLTFDKVYIRKDTDVNISGENLGGLAFNCSTNNVVNNVGGDESVGSVVFQLNGARTVNQTESQAPFALFGDSNGNFRTWEPAPKAGDRYTLRATPFTGPGGLGNAGESLAINFSFIDRVTGPDLAVQSFSLINAQTNQPIPGFNPIPDGAVINLDDLPTDEINIRANTTPNAVGSVRLELSGAQTLSRVERVVPYALFGDSNGNFLSWSPKPKSGESYSLTGTPFTQGGANGQAGQALTIDFSFTRGPQNPPSNFEVLSFSLINAETNQPIRDYKVIRDGATIDLNTLPTKNISIRANTNPGVVGSIVFNLRGAQSVNKTENFIPYALFGDDEGNYTPWQPRPQNGEKYVLTATPFNREGGKGQAGQSSTINFSFVEGGLPAGIGIQSFTLIDADSDVPIAGFDPIPQGAEINLADLPTRNINIRANTNDNSKVGSVAFQLSGSQSRNNLESTAPYALFGDDKGDFRPWAPEPENGQRFTLTATPYTLPAGAGLEGQSRTLQFSFTDDNFGLAVQQSLTLFPNPTTNSVGVNLKGNNLKGSFQLEFYNSQGNLMMSESWDSDTRQVIDVSTLSKGAYIVKVRRRDGKGDRGARTRRLYIE